MLRWPFAKNARLHLVFLVLNVWLATICQQELEQHANLVMQHARHVILYQLIAPPAMVYRGFLFHMSVNYAQILFRTVKIVQALQHVLNARTGML